MKLCTCLCDAIESIKTGQHNHKVIVAANIVCTRMQHRSIIKHVSTLHVFNMLRCMLHCMLI